MVSDMNEVETKKHLLSQVTDRRLIDAFFKVTNKGIFNDEVFLKKLVTRLNNISKGHWAYFNRYFVEELSPYLKKHPNLYLAVQRQLLTSESIFEQVRPFKEWDTDIRKGKEEKNFTYIHLPKEKS